MSRSTPLTKLKVKPRLDEKRSAPSIEPGRAPLSSTFTEGLTVGGSICCRESTRFGAGSHPSGHRSAGLRRICLSCLKVSRGPRSRAAFVPLEFCERRVSGGHSVPMPLRSLWLRGRCNMPLSADSPLNADLGRNRDSDHFLHQVADALAWTGLGKNPSVGVPLATYPS